VSCRKFAKGVIFPCRIAALLHYYLVYEKNFPFHESTKKLMIAPVSGGYDHLGVHDVAAKVADSAAIIQALPD